MARIIAFASGKGGTGKSTVTAELSCALARYGRRVLAVDMEQELRSLDVLLGVENRVVFDFADVLSGRCSISDALTPHERYPALQLLCLSADDLPAREDWARLLQEENDAFDDILLDLPAGTGEAVRLAASLADLLCFVTLPDRIAARDARTLADALESTRERPARLIVNRVDRRSMKDGGFADLDELMDFVGLPLLGVIPEDRGIRSVQLGSRKEERSLLTDTVFDAIACRIMGKYVPLILTEV